MEAELAASVLNNLKGFARCHQSLKLYRNKTYGTHGCLLGLGPQDSGDLVTQKKGLFDIVSSCWLFLGPWGFKYGLHGSS